MEHKMNLTYAREIGEELLGRHGLDEWTLEFVSSYTQMGACYRRKRLIVVSIEYTLLNAEKVFRDTMLHEIAHALDDSGGPSHGLAWQQIARRLGTDPAATNKDSAVNEPAKRWLAVCPGCRQVVMTRQELHRSTRERAFSCGLCAPGRYDPQFRLRWVDRKSLGV